MKMGLLISSLVSAILLLVAAGCGNGDTQPRVDRAPAAEPVFAVEDLERIVIARDEGPPRVDFTETKTKAAAIDFLFDPVEFPGYVDGHRNIFRAFETGKLTTNVHSATFLFENAERASGALIFLEDAFRTPPESDPAIPIEDLVGGPGKESFGVQGSLSYDQPTAPVFVHGWRVGNLVLLVIGEGPKVTRDEVLSMAEAMHSRAVDME